MAVLYKKVRKEEIEKNLGSVVILTWVWNVNPAKENIKKGPLTEVTSDGVEVGSIYVPFQGTHTRIKKITTEEAEIIYED